MAIKILPDENCVGQVNAIFRELEKLDYVELFEIELLTWDAPGQVTLEILSGQQLSVDHRKQDR